MGKICLKCGNELNDNAKFCSKCGSQYEDLKAEEQEEEDEETKEEEQSEQYAPKCTLREPVL